MPAMRTIGYDIRIRWGWMRDGSGMPVVRMCRPHRSRHHHANTTLKPRWPQYEGNAFTGTIMKALPAWGVSGMDGIDQT